MHTINTCMPCALDKIQKQLHKETLHTVFIAQKLLKNANKWKNYQCRSKAYIGDYAKALLSLKNKVIIHEYGRYNVASTMWEVGL